MAREKTLIVVAFIMIASFKLFYNNDEKLNVTKLSTQFRQPTKFNIRTSGYEKQKPLKAAVACSANVKVPKRPTFWSQSREDYALLRRYYSKPLKCGGTYLEIGALNGVRYSNTLFFEKYLDWSGVLIEAQPQNAKQLHKNRPKSRTFGMGVCDEGTDTLRFTGGGAVGAVASEVTQKHLKQWIHENKTVEIPCKPLSWILKKANVKQIDFFSLDVEGSEYFVLKTMDWSVPVGVFVVEVHQGDAEGMKRDAMVVQLLTDHGYQKANWNIASYCLRGHACAGNVVYENRNYPNLPKVNRV